MASLLFVFTYLPTTAQLGPGGIESTDGASGLVLWLDASTLNNVDGANIVTWPDQSGYGNDGYGNYDAFGSSPQFNANSLNGLGQVEFIATTKDYIGVAHDASLMPTTVSVFVVGSMTSSSRKWGGFVMKNTNALTNGYGIGRGDQASGNDQEILGFISNYSSNFVEQPITYSTPGVFSMVYDKTQIEIYANEGTPVTDAHTADITSNTSPVYVGWTSGHLDGNIAEVIIINRAVNDAERIIIDNYLAAKWGIALAGNDAYDEDTHADNFDHDVAGIGRVDGSNIHDDAQGTGIIRINNPSALSDDEFFIWGFDNGELEGTEYSDVPTGVEARFPGQWGVSEADASGDPTGVDVGSVDITIELADLGSINASDLRLLVDTDSDGSYVDESPISGATHVSGNLYLFSGVTAIDDSDRFTFGTANRTSTPLSPPPSAAGPRGPGGVGKADGASSLVLWLDGNTITGATDGAPLATWEDQSGYGNDAIGNYDSYGTVPDFSENSLNGYSQVSFTASDLDYMGVAHDASLMPSTVSVFTVGNMTSSSQTYGGYVMKNVEVWDDGYGIGRGDAFSGNDEQLAGFISDISNDVAINVTYGSPGVYALVYDNTQIELYGNEGTPGTRALSGTIATNSAPLYVGWTGAHLDGEIAEVVVYNEAVNDAQRIIIDNYLAAKYGIALTSNDVYDEDSHANNYDHDVAGIGRVSSTHTHEDAQGTGIVRVLNPTNLGDNEFLMWGHDNGALTDTETVDIPASLDRRLERVWRASETGEVGSIDMVWDLSAIGTTDTMTLRLLVDTNNDGSFADEVPIRGATLLSGNSFYFSGVDAINDNLSFTVGFVQPAPGHVADNLVLWLKADEGLTGTAPVTAWDDLSPNTNNTTGSAPTSSLITNAINYNPAIDFNENDGLADYFSTTATDILGATQSYTKFAVVVPTLIENNNSIIAGNGTAPAAHVLRINGTGQVIARHGGTNYAMSTTLLAADSSYVISNRYGPDELEILRINGNVEVSTTESIVFTDGNLQVGSRNNGTGGWDGYIAEVIVYDDDISDAEVARVESYLAAKYGLTLDKNGGGDSGDLLDSDGITIWNADVNSAYHNDLSVIGRDDNSLYYQRQSRAPDDSLRVYIGSLASDNASNSGTITNDQSYLIVGHNGGRLQSMGSTEMPPTVTARFDREWKVTNVNFADSYTLEFEWEEVGAFDINDIRLLVDADGDFSDATIYGPADGLTFSVGSIIVEGVSTSQIPANSSMYVTVASIGSTPLPVELIHFEALANPADHTVDLTWSTATETDNDFFTIEKSQDARDWAEVLRISGAGNYSGRIDYEAVDEDPYHGLSYYRLKQTDFDGTFSHSNTVFVTLGDFEKELTIYPNPTQRLLTIKGSPEQLRTIRVIDVRGAELTTSVRIISRTDSTVTLDVSKLPVGIFTILTGPKSIKMIKTP